MDSVKSFFAGSSKGNNNLGNHQQQNGHGSESTNRWGRNWNSSSQHMDTSSTNSTSINKTNHCDAKRKDSDNYFYIMWRA
ncbi:uncharacterized protein LOC117192913 [Drosophila miranda]|uniref:uncharacterized protein LOC108158365 n=1 Tax=Drosophila miranda TaxID=7229 RepID=UPI0007E5D60E|nr:uncharacterized protein LOC108158365 [Drosophila miranda]XP_033253539.1 uncharacterized protein LOC117192913 [Drosophila miranda]